MAILTSNTDIVENRLEVCTNGPLVYLRTFKCASTFFYRNFVDTYKWNEIQFRDIDWSRQRVFTHMLDPIQRRHKGVAEFLHMTKCHQYLSTRNFQNFISNVKSLDVHSTSYFDLYGNFCYIIDWIPLLGSYYENIEITEKLLKEHGQRMFAWNHDWAHASDQEKKITEQQLEKLWQQNQDTLHLSKLYWEKDVMLYNKVCQKFNKFGNGWDNISWLKDQLS